jgi:hypothetical protein
VRGVLRVTEADLPDRPVTDYPQLEEAWIWPDRVQRWVRERVTGHTLHVCSGESSIGDVTLDADSDRTPDVQADMAALPFRDCTFDTAVWDPPWKVDLFSRPKPFIELVRVTNPGGRILTNTTWVPRSDQTTLNQVWVRQDQELGNASLLIEHTRYPGQTTLPT